MPAARSKRQRDPWLPWFAASIVAVVWALAALAFVTFNLIDDDEPRVLAGESTPPADTTPPPGAVAGLTYAGFLPSTAAALGLRQAAEGAVPDIEFAREASGGVVIRYFVPVASLGAGVDSLSSDELRRLMAGEITDWAEVGGIPGDVTTAVASHDDLQAYARTVFGAAAQGGDPRPVEMEGYDELRRAMTVDSRILAIIPIEELGPEMVAIALDGIDIARGTGDPALWPLAERVEVLGRTDRGKAQVEAIKDAIAARLPEVITVVATGDVLQSRCSLAAIRATGDWAAALRGPVGEYLAAADLALSSLDGSIQGIAEPYGCIETTNLTSPPEVVQALTLAGIDEMTLATNHAFDCADGGCGSDALLESMKHLHAAGIKTVGGGKNLEEALAPAIFEVKGVRFGVLGFDDIAAEHLQATDSEPGTAPLDDSYEDERADPPEEPAFYKSADLLGVTRLQERIRDLKQQVDVVIVQVQSGTEDTHIPSPRSIKALRAAAAAGADLVVGNQAHWVQAVELRGNSFVAYALGNFIFDQRWTPEHTQGYLLEATFHGKKLATVRMVPYQIQDRYRPAFVQGEVRAKILGDVIAAYASIPD